MGVCHNSLVETILNHHYWETQMAFKPPQEKKPLPKQEVGEFGLDYVVEPEEKPDHLFATKTTLGAILENKEQEDKKRKLQQLGNELQLKTGEQMNKNPQMQGHPNGVPAPVSKPADPNYKPHYSRQQMEETMDKFIHHARRMEVRLKKHEDCIVAIQQAFDELMQINYNQAQQILKLRNKLNSNANES